MKFEELLAVVSDEPVFETGLLLAGDVDSRDVRRQLSRWVTGGRLIQLRRGLYALAPPYRKVRLHPFIVANRLQLGSYVSCQSALSHYGLIPEHVPVTTSVGPGRPGRRDTPIGSFVFRHLCRSLLRALSPRGAPPMGYRATDLGDGQQGLLATPEKALLDLIYLEAGADRPEYLRELRLQNLDVLDPDALIRLAEELRKPKLVRAAERIVRLREAELGEYDTL